MRTSRAILALVVGGLALRLFGADASATWEPADAHSGTVWTAIIPEAFPGYLYTWYLQDDGEYREDGRDPARGVPIQPTLSGRWRRDGARMVLRQDGLGYVFDGVVLGGLYIGTLYLDGRSVSRFCAAQGDQAPEHCGGASGVAAD